MNALNDYMMELGTAKKYIIRLNEYLNDNGEVAPDDVNWANVGDMARIAAMLKDIVTIIDGHQEE